MIKVSPGWFEILTASLGITAWNDAPWCLDLYCKGGGAALGYKMAGYNVLGVDKDDQPDYPFWRVKADAIWFGHNFGYLFALIHASPPCQDYTEATLQWRMNGYEYDDLIAETRTVLRKIGRPYVIENVPAAAHLLVNPLLLCGTMFNLYVTRHRYFECSPELWFSPLSCRHALPNVKMGRKPKRFEEYIQPVGHFSDVEYAQIAMGIPWLGQDGLREAIPPAFTHYIGSQMIRIENGQQNRDCALSRMQKTRRNCLPAQA